MAKKLTTKEILAAARAKDTGKSKDEAPAEEQADAPESEVDDSPAETASESASEASEKPAAPKTAPKSTKDILAAARAQAGGGALKETETTEKESATPAAKKPGGTPKSTKDILAAARAQAGSGGAASAEKPAAEKKAASKPAAASSPAGERPSVQEMLSAVREGKPAEEAKEVEAKPTPAKPILPPKPQKPAPAAKPEKAGKETRRGFLVTPLVVAWVFFAGTMGAWGLALARFMMPNVLVEPPSKFKIGPPSDYSFGTVSTKWKSEFAVWIVHTAYNGQPVVYALSTVCTHLGCTPNWLEAEQKFKCPCHGSGFYINGVNFEGPAPRPLERHAIQLAADGMLEVDKSMKFQEEMGQWEDSASFYVSSES